jgi:hypothetical protein
MDSAHSFYKNHKNMQLQSHIIAAMRYCKYKAWRLAKENPPGSDAFPINEKDILSNTARQSKRRQGY